jgi:hypothetical protein
MMRALQLIIVAIWFAVSVAACAKARAHAEPELPVLTPPPPPPRVVDIYNDAPVPTVEPGVAENAMVTPPPRAPAKPAVPRAEPPAKPEPARAEPERPAMTPPALTLKPPAGGETKTEASIREMLGRAFRDLSRVDYGTLNNDGRVQYDTAKRFMQQAEDALRGGNIIFAGKLADKAATMAAVLVR